METSSETRCRGRPNTFSEAELKDVGERGPLSRRQLQNRAYALRARGRLAALRWWEEVCEDPYVPQCVLGELGRMGDGAEFDEAAWWYCYSGQELKAKQAAETIRQMRTGKTLEEGPTTLHDRLMDTVRGFRLAYPYASHLYVEEQVRLALDTVSHVRRNGHRYHY